MIIRLADGALQPWKNGLGSTREIAVQPSAAGSDDFLWRVSVANVDSAAPFSRFPGIDRHIALLDGAGFHMTLDDDQTHDLTVPFAPFAFAGEARVDVSLVGGATSDFNLMVRRRHLRGDVQVLTGPAIHDLNGATQLVFCARGRIDTVEGSLGVGDAWRSSISATHRVTLHDNAVALVVRVEAHSP